MKTKFRLQHKDLGMRQYPYFTGKKRIAQKYRDFVEWAFWDKEVVNSFLRTQRRLWDGAEQIYSKSEGRRAVKLAFKLLLREHGW